MTLPVLLDALVGVVADLLDRLALKHAFGGAIANNYWGVVRVTQDVDVLVLIPSLKYQELATALGDAGFTMRGAGDVPLAVDVPQMREEARDRKLFALYRDDFKAEFFVPFIPLQDEILRRATRLPFGDRKIPVTTAEDLVLLKMSFHRDKDLRDVKGILAAQKGKLDRAYLRRWASQMLDAASRDELEKWIGEYGS